MLGLGAVYEGPVPQPRVALRRRVTVRGQLDALGVLVEGALRREADAHPFGFTRLKKGSVEITPQFRNEILSLFTSDLVLVPTSPFSTFALPVPFEYVCL